MYESGSILSADLDKHYRAELKKLGWTPTHEPAARDGAHGLLVMRNGVTATISNSKMRDSDRAIITIMPLDTGGATRVGPTQ